MNHAKIPGIFLCGAILFFSCQTAQKDLMLSSFDEAAGADITELEKLIVSFDAGFTPEQLAAARRYTGELERKPVQDRVFRAQLAAWSGRLYLLEQERRKAAEQLALSRELLPGSVQGMVLAARLELDFQKRLALIDEFLRLEPSSGELTLERARTFLEMDHYREAAAAFDAAFARLSPEVYEAVYRPDRNRAWDMRNILPGAEATTSEIVQRPVVSWRDVIQLTKTETGLLTFLTAGKEWSNEELFSRLADRSFIPAVQDAALTEMSAGNPSISGAVLRSGAAWFLWHLVAENRSDKSLLTRYSARYRNARNPASPIPDIPLGSVFFDSVLGCVEREIMTLPDGRIFAPNENLRGAAFLNMLGKAGQTR
jgi:tetratricopeptide (TPR) repeat protein